MNDTLSRLMEEYPPSDPAIVDDCTGDWALVEINTSKDEWWITLHDSPEDAGDYSVGQEDGAWQPHILVHVPTFETFTPVLHAPTWKPLNPMPGMKKDLTTTS